MFNLIVSFTEPVRGSSKDSRGIFSPRMEYDEWTPLGRGDPLKNDPTYDYVPPVLERVHYWIEPSSRTPDPLIPTIGYASKDSEVSRVFHKRPDDVHRETDNSSADSRKDVYDPFFLKLVDGPTFSTKHRNQQHFYHHHYLVRPSSTASQQPNSPSSIHHHISPYYAHSYQQKNHQKQIPYENHPPVERHNQKENHRTTLESADSQAEIKQNRPAFETQGFQMELHNHQEENQQPRPPYTILVPPPLQIPNSFTSMSDTQKPVQVVEMKKVTTQAPSRAHPSVTPEQANLVYQHSSTLPTLEWEEGKTQLATLAGDSSHVTRKAPTPTKHDKYPFGNLYHEPFSSTTVHHHSPNFEVVPSKELHFNDSNNINFPTHQQPLQWSSNMMVTTVASSTVSMTTASPLTTDPLFSHYKQPIEPLRGPMYLIIQGHSKVKTYGATKQQNSYHGIPIQESNDINQQGSGENNNDRIGKAVEHYTGNEPSEKNILNSVKIEAAFLQNQDNAEFSTKENAVNEKREGFNLQVATAKASPFTDEDGTPARKKGQLTLDEVIQLDDITAEEVVRELRT